MVNKKIQEEEQQLFQLYNRFPLVLDHGEGVYLYDTDGKKYLDFAAGIAVMSLGYQNKELEESCLLYTSRSMISCRGKKSERYFCRESMERNWKTNWQIGRAHV